MFLQYDQCFLIGLFWSSVWTFEFSLLKRLDVPYLVHYWPAAAPQCRLTDITTLSGVQVTCTYLHIQTEMSRETVERCAFKPFFRVFFYIIPGSFYHILFQSSDGFSLGCQGDCWIPAKSVHLQSVLVILHQASSVCVTTELLLHCWSCSAELSAVCYSSASLVEAGSSL